MLNLDEMHRAYMGAALWSSTDDDGNPLDDGRDWTDIDEQSRDAMLQDCKTFAEQNAAMLEAFMLALPEREDCSKSEQVGHDFWLTRNGHGAGFWDRGTGEPGEALSKACGWRSSFGPVDLYVGGDGKVHQS